ncbi:MAG: effector binding domain-containing protein [Eubacteriales bacterium]|nr:effector binding domain-containing protein [Eubacteriales bacterium]
MNLTTISEISKKLSISTRTLRYYEQIGLIESVKKEDYAYRTYDEAAVIRLQQILVLRKLRLPLKQIALILKSENTAVIIDAFRQNLAEVDDEITALSTIRDIINSFISRLKESIHQDIKVNLLDDTALLEAVDALTVQKEPLKEEKTAKDLQAASEMLLKLTDRDVRIVYLPPMTVASIHIVGQDASGEHAEYTTAMILDDFIERVNLKSVYPAARNFGFNNPDGISDDDPNHGYERWVSIPDDMEVTAPLTKKHLEGGMYAAHVIPMGAWDEGWMPLYNWVDENNDRYVGRWSTIDGVCGWIEEHLNYWDWNNSYDGKAANQVDLLMPIKPRFAAGTRHPQERIVETFNYNGIPVEVVEWDATIWCGKIGYAKNNTDEPDVDPILSAFMSLPIPSMNERIEPNWDVCMSFNYFTNERPKGVMFADLVGTENQPEGFDVYNLPAGQYLRLAINEDSAKALASQPFNGGIPPYEWVGEQLAPQFGYQYGDDYLPVFEYYGYYKPEKNAHEFRYLYVPVEKIAK